MKEIKKTVKSNFLKRVRNYGREKGRVPSLAKHNMQMNSAN